MPAVESRARSQPLGKATKPAVSGCTKAFVVVPQTNLVLIGVVGPRIRGVRLSVSDCRRRQAWLDTSLFRRIANPQCHPQRREGVSRQSKFRDDRRWIVAQSTDEHPT